MGRVEYQRPTVPSQPVRLTPRPAFLAGREDLLADLDARLSAGERGGPRVVALCGLGGAGKTSVALEYAHRHLAGLRVVWQFPAEEATALAAGFGDLAAQLGARDLLDASDPVAQVHAVLAARPGDWLLIFDNAPRSAALQGVLPPAGHGQVLITSQDPHWPGRQAVDVPALDQDVAAAFLLTRTGSADHAAAWELAAELGGLPLALEQACAYMQAAGRSLAGYLTLFRPVRQRVSGPEHPDTLADRHNLGYWTGKAGDPVSARDQFTALLPVRQRMLGAEHPDTLADRADLAYWTGKAGDPVSARDQYAALLPVRQRVSGPEHPDTLIARADLAYWTGKAEDPVSARDQYAALLPIRERVLGTEHPDTLADRANLAYWTGQADSQAEQ